MSKPKVYLSGPIAGQSYADAIDWRIRARQLLGGDIEAFSPMRGKEILAGMYEIDVKPWQSDTLALQPKGIVTRDRNDVQMCDAMLLYLPRIQEPPTDSGEMEFRNKRVSIGSMIEIGWADAWRKPIVTVMEYPNVHAHIFVAELSGWVVETLEEGAALCRALLLPGY